MTISGAEVNAGPFRAVGEALEVVPGLIVTQHSGEGKANQYFCAASISTTAPTSPSGRRHARQHADSWPRAGLCRYQFMIPELIQSVNVRKGPYFADVGDFGSAGSVAIDYVNKLPKNIAERRSAALAIAARWRRARPRVGAGHVARRLRGRCV
jgi:hypothetical protein